jgi:PAS domain S-box-containing protein
LSGVTADSLPTARGAAAAFGPTRSIVAYALKFAAILAAYYLLAAVLPAILDFKPPPLFWPPSGIALALLLLLGYSVLPAIACGSFMAAVALGYPLLSSGIVVTGLIIAVSAAFFLTRHWLTQRQAFASAVDALTFSFICFVPLSALSSAAAIGTLMVANSLEDSQIVPTWLTLWAADGIGSFLSAAVIVLWISCGISFSRLLETIALVALAASISFLAFTPSMSIAPLAAAALGTHRSTIAFTIAPVLIWSVLRGDPRMAATIALTFVGAMALSFTVTPAEVDYSGYQHPLALALSFTISVGSVATAAEFLSRSNIEERLRVEVLDLSQQLAETSRSLDAAKYQFQVLVEDVADHAIFILDPGGHVASWNTAAARIIGYSPDEIVGQPFGIFYRPDERRSGEAVAALEAAIRNGKQEVEGWRVKRDGTPFFVNGAVSAIRNSEGALIGFASVMRDATERRQAREKLVEAREQLAMAQKMEAIGKLTGGIAHDFNNLLMIIGGNAQTFKRLLDPKLPRAIEAIQTAAKRGEKLTRQLLTFSRNQHLSPTVIDLAVVIQDMRPMIESSLRGNIVYRENIEQRPVFTKVDGAELELAIVNLAVNARDAMPNGGNFTLSLSVSNEPPSIQRGLRGDAGFAVLQFCDTGTGIPPNLLSKIFDPFFTTKEVGKGTGLGLSQVYGFAHQAGGTIKAESKVGAGTTFSIYLPRCSENELPASTPIQQSISLRSKVLVVDDNPDVAEVTSSLFDNMGYEPTYRDSAEAALEYLDSGAKVDLVFSDIVMPGSIDGIGLANEIRRRHPGVRIVLTTGYSDAVQSVPVDLQVIKKPFDSEALTHTVRKALETELA